MSEEEKKFLEIVDLKKGFGSGQTRQEVLRGMNFPLQKGVLCAVRMHPVPENPHCSISSEALITPIPVTSISTAIS